MNPAYVKEIVLLANIIFFILRGVIKWRVVGVPVAKRRIGAVEIVLMMVVTAGQVVPLIWLATQNFAFADYSAHPSALIVGAMLYVWGLWLLHRTNGDLGKQWSPSLELKDDHRLVKEGIYRRIRHPMYLSLLIFAGGQMLALPNYVAGPAALVAMLVLIAFRLRAEERMMIEEFGDEYKAYRKRTNRLIPGLW
jgi:protein-S-isoprenylcysteine O-methyltransferase Ste14